MKAIKNLNDYKDQSIAFVRTHNEEHSCQPKDVAISLVPKAAKILDNSRWKGSEEIARHLKEHEDDTVNELADVPCWITFITHYFEIDSAKAFKRKTTQDEQKYLVEKVKGNHAKYTSYQNR